jgi:DNA mismatch repair protein MSH6
MGAADSLLLARSTFFEEMAETADILRLATPASLIIFDELGHGTSTSDGAAIAGAVLAAVAASRARTLFITHFVRALAVDAAPAGTVAVAHMGATVGREGEGPDAEDTVTFTYKLTPGVCPKSYGTNVARLAGLPPAVVSRADELAGALDAGGGLKVAGGVPRAVAAAVRAVAAAAAAGDAGALDAVRARAARVVVEEGG